MKDDSAQVAIRDYIHEEYQAKVTGKVDRLKSLSDGTCQACEKFAKVITDAVAQGGHFEAGPAKVRSIAPAANWVQSSTQQQYRVIARVPRARVVWPGKRPPHVYSAGPSIRIFALTRDDTDWLVDEIYVEDS